MLAPELGWRKTHRAAEHARKQILMAEAGKPADVRDRSFRFDEHPLGIFDADAADFSRRCATKQPHKPLLERPPCYSQLRYNVRYSNARLRVVTNQSQRLADHFIVD